MHHIGTFYDLPFKPGCDGQIDAQTETDGRSAIHNASSFAEVGTAQIVSLYRIKMLQRNYSVNYVSYIGLGLRSVHWPYSCRNALVEIRISKNDSRIFPAQLKQIVHCVNQQISQSTTFHNALETDRTFTALWLNVGNNRLTLLHLTIIEFPFAHYSICIGDCSVIEVLVQLPEILLVSSFV